MCGRGGLGRGAPLLCAHGAGLGTPVVVMGHGLQVALYVIPGSAAKRK